MTKSLRAVIRGIGTYLPKQILSNADLEKMVETSDEWIVTRTGIRERRMAAKDEFTSTMGIEASKIALQNAQIEAKDVDLIITCTMTPDYLCPSTATLIQSGIQATNAAAFDLQAACTGFLYGLATAKAFLESNMAKTVLLVSSEKNTAFTDFTDRTTCILFGDGASACVLTKGGPGFVVNSVSLGADGSLADLLTIPAGGSRLPRGEPSDHTIKMNGKEIFKHAVRRMEISAKECLDTNGVTQEEIAWLVPHQANIRIIEAIAKRFTIPWEKVAQTIEKFGNTSASTIPIALDHIGSTQGFKNGDKILLTAFGGGLSWGSALLTFED